MTYANPRCRAVGALCHAERMEDDLRSNSSALNSANKSTGPTSPEGKARSARNSEKHGMYTSAVLLHHESAEEFAAVIHDYYLQFVPATHPETDLVGQMIAATWRLRRLAALEAAALDHAMDVQRVKLDATYQDLCPETSAHFAFDQLANEGAAMATNARFQAAQLRQYDCALRSLLILRGGHVKNNKK